MQLSGITRDQAKVYINRAKRQVKGKYRTFSVRKVGIGPSFCDLCKCRTDICYVVVQFDVRGTNKSYGINVRLCQDITACDFRQAIRG